MTRPYPSYQDSVVEWLGEVPEHWEVRRLGSLGAFSKGSGGTKDDKTDSGFPCIWYGELYTQHEFHITSSTARVAETDVEKYEMLRYGDLLFAGSDVTPLRIGKSAVNLINERAYCGADVIIFRPTVELDARFLGYASESHTSKFQKRLMGRGVTVMHIYGSELKNLTIPMPPLDEQTGIASFLDRETAKIDMLVAETRRLLDRLAEYRTALITRTVTKGLPPEAAEEAGFDPNPPLKPSGVEWLGDIPEHWQVTHLRRFVEWVKTGTTPPSVQLSDLAGDDIAWFSPGDIGSVLQMKLPSRTLANKAVADGFTPLFPAESTLIVGIGATTGRVGHTSKPSTGNQQLTCIVGNDRIFSRFLSWQLWARTKEISAIVPYATLPILNNDFLLSLSFLAPSLREQQAIVTFLGDC